MISGELPGPVSVERIRVRGTVQGVGFRPMVWRLANEHGLFGWVGNDGQGVTILVKGTATAIDAFAAELRTKAPPLSRIEAIERGPSLDVPDAEDFRIVSSLGGNVQTRVAPDAATCPECLAEISDPAARRYRYPFTNCTHCGPRLSIIQAIPYDRATTTMRNFALCPDCAEEYGAPEDRRFHAQPIACPACGPHTRLERADGSLLFINAPIAPPDDLDATRLLLEQGHIVAIKGMGGFQLACDAGNEVAVARLRQRKQREFKPFALMAKDMEIIRRYCAVSEAEAALLSSPAAPIVILDTRPACCIAASVAPGIATLGFMLPNTPLHHLLMQDMDRPIVLTSGNLSDEPQCIDNADARIRLSDIADAFLTHDRGIARRIDDSVVRVVAGEARVMRRARGYAPAPIRLPDGFESSPPVLAMGGELKNTFCLLREGEAILSHHIGDLADARCHDDYVKTIGDYQALFEHAPRLVAVDLHPEYLSRKLGIRMAAEGGVRLSEVQHHHAHIAACMAENGLELDAPPVLGIALDGLGYGENGQLWGCEFLLADYCQYRRLGRLKPVAMPGGAQAIHAPWRNTYAQLMTSIGREKLAERYGELELCGYLSAKPGSLLDGMMARNINSPMASSCGRLFDAVAAAVGICRDHAFYEGQAAVEFEALVDRQALIDEDDSHAYPFDITPAPDDKLCCMDPAPMWLALLDDLAISTPLGLIAARFHKAVAIAIVRMAEALARRATDATRITTVALSGGVFQNRIVLEQVHTRLKHCGFRVLVHRHVPANDGGLALGQAVVAAAKAMAGSENR